MVERSIGGWCSSQTATKKSGGLAKVGQFIRAILLVRRQLFEARAGWHVAVWCVAANWKFPTESLSGTIGMVWKATVPTQCHSFLALVCFLPWQALTFFGGKQWMVLNRAHLLEVLLQGEHDAGSWQ